MADLRFVRTEHGWEYWLDDKGRTVRIPKAGATTESIVAERDYHIRKGELLMKSHAWESANGGQEKAAGFLERARWHDREAGRMTEAMEDRAKGAAPAPDGRPCYQLSYDADREMHLLRCGSITVQIPRVSNAQTLVVERLVADLNSAERQAALLDAAMRTMDGFIEKFSALFSKQGQGCATAPAKKDNGVRTGDVKVYYERLRTPEEIAWSREELPPTEKPDPPGVFLREISAAFVDAKCTVTDEFTRCAAGSLSPPSDPPAQTWRDRDPLL